VARVLRWIKRMTTGRLLAAYCADARPMAPLARTMEIFKEHFQ